MARYELDASEANLHGHFSQDLSPALTLEPGDSVVYRIPDAGWSLHPYPPHTDVRPEIRPRDIHLNSGHCLSGPVFVKGAKPGMVLEIRIEEVVPSEWGWTWIGWPCDFSKRLGLHQGKPQLIRWQIDANAMRAVSEFGNQVAVRPFLGVMGVAPSKSGVFSTVEPYHGGGNLDCCELVAGSSLFLPIECEGALFSCGDGHARQGDGELCGTALECAVERAELTFLLHQHMPLSEPGRPHISSLGFDRMPRARTGEGWMTFGLHESLDEAMHIAAEEMFELIQTMADVDRKIAAGLASVAVDFRITQSVNSVKGVHAILPHGALE